LIIIDIFKLLARLLLILLIPVFLGYGTYRLMERMFFSPVDPGNTKSVLFQIAPGSSFKQICNDLEKEGLVKYAWSLDIISRLKKVDKQIHAGEYELNKAMRPTDILTHLVSGKIYERRITVKEGVSVWEIGKLLEDVGLITKKEFNAAIVDVELLRQAGIPEESKSFEGYLFPDTYAFSRPIDAKRIIWTMLKQGTDKWPDEFTTRAEELKMTRHEILTLASIIEKESGSKIEEQPLISAVFHNRLKQGMKLQADPTVIYGIPNFNGNLTRQNLETPTPYNTYTNFGLPPGPIANAGFSAIKAALYPANSEAVYFVSNNKGEHVFSNTLEEHNKAVATFQQKKPADTN
jgi:UPF0755 protein